MLDRHVVPLLKKPLHHIAEKVARHGVSADQVTLAGFVAGVLSFVALTMGAYGVALVLMLINRAADGIDGELARLQKPTAAGGFLDITLDFIFYAIFPLGFAIANPQDNALPAAVLIASFVGTGASFLAFASMVANQNIQHPEFAYKGLYYLNGLAEGTETILCFCLMCLLPAHFATIAYVFAAVCVLTAANRVVFGFLTLRK